MRLKITDIEESNFYKMPKSIYDLPLSSIDREIYMLCLENWRLSVSNKWINENGEIYFYATQEKISEVLKAGRSTVIRSFKKLIENDLLEIEKENGNANKYFLKKIIKVAEKNYQYQNDTGIKMSEHQYQNETCTSIKMKHNKELINKNELTKINVSIYQSQEFKQAFSDFLMMRKQIKKPATDKAIQLLLNKLEIVADEGKAINMLENSITNNWKDIYPIKERSENNGNKKYKPDSKAKRRVIEKDYSEGSDYFNS